MSSLMQYFEDDVNRDSLEEGEFDFEDALDLAIEHCENNELIIDKIDLALEQLESQDDDESISLEQLDVDIQNLLTKESMESMGLVDYTVGTEAKIGGLGTKNILRRYKHFYEQSFIKMFNYVVDMMKNTNNVVNKYVKKLDKVENKLKKKEEKLKKEEHKGDMVGIVTYWMVKGRVIRDPLKQLEIEKELIEYVYEDFSDSVKKEFRNAEQIVEAMASEEDLTAWVDSKMNRVKHPVELFDKKHTGEKKYMHNTSIVVEKGEKGGVLEQLAEKRKINIEKALGVVAIFPDATMTTKEIYELISATRDYSNHVSKFVKNLTEMRKTLEAFEKTVSDDAKKAKENENLKKKEISQVFSYVRNLGTTYLNTSLKLTKRNLSVIKGGYYLSNRMVSLAK